MVRPACTAARRSPGSLRFAPYPGKWSPGEVLTADTTLALRRTRANGAPGEVLTADTTPALRPIRVNGRLRGTCRRTNVAKSFAEFGDAFVTDEAADEKEGECVRNAQLFSELHDFGSTVVPFKVDAPNIPMPQDPYILMSDSSRKKIIPHPLPLSDNIRRTSASEPVGGHQKTPFQASGSRKNEPSERVNTDFDSGELGGHHRKKASLRSETVDNVWTLFPEHLIKPQKRPQILKRSDPPLHRNLHHLDPLKSLDSSHPLPRRRDSHHLVTCLDKLSHSPLEEIIKGHRDRGNVKDLAHKEYLRPRVAPKVSGRSSPLSA